MRISREEFFMNLARQYGTRNTCPRAKGACVLVKDNRLIAAGYVSSLPGTPHCEDAGCEIGPVVEGCQRTTHSEAALVAHCAKLGIATKDSILYTVNGPCPKCAKLIILSGIRKIYFEYQFRDKLGIDLLETLEIYVYQAHNHDSYFHIHKNSEFFHGLESDRHDHSDHMQHINANKIASLLDGID